jgi:hypothetical protein
MSLVWLLCGWACGPSLVTVTVTVIHSDYSVRNAHHSCLHTRPRTTASSAARQSRPRARHPLLSSSWQGTQFCREKPFPCQSSASPTSRSTSCRGLMSYPPCWPSALNGRVGAASFNSDPHRRGSSSAVLQQFLKPPAAANWQPDLHSKAYQAALHGLRPCCGSCGTDARPARAAASGLPRHAASQHHF